MTNINLKYICFLGNLDLKKKTVMSRLKKTTVQKK